MIFAIWDQAYGIRKKNVCAADAFEAQAIAAELSALPVDRIKAVATGVLLTDLPAARFVDD